MKLTELEKAMLIECIESAEMDVARSLAVIHRRNPGSLVAPRFREWLDRADALKLRLRP